jgi:ketosteroid isomerase-like protein
VPDPEDALRLQLTVWLDEWSACVRARDYEAARSLFNTDVVGFGTHMRVVHGLEDLERDQWRNVWGTIEDFRFLTEQLECGTSNDGLLAWVVVPWSSTGFDAEGTGFDRPGRATIVLERAVVDSRWRAIHTHISLAPGTPQRSFGR